MGIPRIQQQHQKKSSSSISDVKQRVNSFMNKLSDRDTEAMAVSELESMARTLTGDSLNPFLSAISDTRPSDKTPLRRHSLRLLSVLSQTQPRNSLHPLLPRMISVVLRRLRDPDSSVRSASVDAVRSMAAASSAAHFSSLFLKPLSESLFLEQDQNAQMGSAMCLAAAIEAAPRGSDEDYPGDDRVAQMLQRLVPRLVKLAKNDGFKAKPSLLSLLGIIVAAGGAATSSALGILVPCLVEFLSSEDWASRKAAVEALSHVAGIPEKHLLAGFKSSCISSFEARRFDKVRIVRDSMSQMLEAWKDVPSGFDEDDNNALASFPKQSQSYSSLGENVSDGRFPTGSRSYISVQSSSPCTAKKNRSPVHRSPPPDASSTPATRKNTSASNDKRSSPPLFRKLDRKKPSNWKIEVAVPQTLSSMVVSEDNIQNHKERSGKVWLQGESESTAKSKLEAKRVLFENNSEDNTNRYAVFKPGSRVVPLQEEGCSDATIGPATVTSEPYGNHKDNDLSLIRKQLVQIENQQSSLLDLLQRFIGSSQNGIRCLETRVHGLEMALDEMSHDLAITSGRMPIADPVIPTCCNIPGAEFLSSKFWKRTEGRSSSRFPMSSIPPVTAMRNMADKESAYSFKIEKRRFGLQSGFIVNPLAEANPQRGNSEVGSNRMLKNGMQVSGYRHSHDSNMLNASSAADMNRAA